MRADAYRFAAPGTPEAKMPGWLDPSMTRVRWKEAQETEARRQAEAEQKALEADMREMRALVGHLNSYFALRREAERASHLWPQVDRALERFNIAYACYFGEDKAGYNPAQPRVPAGNSDGGQWTSGAAAATQAPRERPVANAGTEGSIDQPPSPPEPPRTSGAATGTESRVIRVQMAVDQRPIYDKADAALLTPKGVNAAGSEQSLKYTLDDGVDYLGGVTVINEDRTILGRLAPSFGRSVVDVTFNAQVQTADGVSTSSFRIQRELGPGGSITIPWKEFGSYGDQARWRSQHPIRVHSTRV